jgi:CheY-like chemotaxis protein
MLNESLSGQRVLVVEDEYFIAEDVAGALRRAGAEVVGPVPSEAAARGAIMRCGTLDLAVLDINLQGATVFALADMLADLGVPFVFATGYLEESIPERFRHVPRWGKPFDVTALVDSLGHG